MEKRASDRQPIRPFKTTTATAVHRCIYCGVTDGLTKEHVIPYFLAGGLTLPKASCKDCSDITKSFENELAYTFFFALRRRYKLQSRSTGGPPNYRLIVDESGNKVERLVQFDQLPPVVPWPVFQGAGILDGTAPTNLIKNIRFSFANVSDSAPGPYLDGKFAVEVDLHLFMRLMAKMAHGALIAGDWDKRWQPLLQDAVRFGQLLPFYVGTCDDTQVTMPEVEAPPGPGATLKPLQKVWTYETRLSQDLCNEYLVTVIEPFCPARSPRYEVATYPSA